MLTLKFVCENSNDPERKIQMIKQGRELQYEHVEIQSEDEFSKKYGDLVQFGLDVLKTLKEQKQAHFVHMMWWNDNETNYMNAVLHGGYCYVMNEQGKTVDIIS